MMSSESTADGDVHPERLSPSQFMRGERPENYSDTEDQVDYELDESNLEYHLDSLTSRNQTHDFEIFCRKLCERTICPHLRAQTGPDGGGDSKADSETFPVAEEIKELTYVGDANDGRERWAFAFSAKAKWKDKIRSDVTGLAATGRSYQRIVCVTSQFAKSKDRAALEDELAAQYGIPVTIHDRTWIVQQVIENDRKDLAYNYLKVGKAKSDPQRLGPKDYSRVRQLDALEKKFDDPEAYQGMASQLVVDALLAAQLSRCIEKPRVETEGRFNRAIRMAKKHGTYRQHLESQYEDIWTAFWWFNDFAYLLDKYDAFEKFALETRHARNLGFLCNLLQLLVNTVVHGHASRAAADLDQRTATLVRALKESAADSLRPNNQLEAETSLLIIKLNQAILDGHRDKLSGLWPTFAELLDRAAGLGEFDVDRLIKMTEVAGQVAGNDPVYNQLAEKVAKFVSQRSGEAKGSLILLKRAQQLDFDSHFDMIRLLSRAAIGLMKHEHTGSLIEALQRLTLAYRSAGLLWASRASCTFVIASLLIEGEEKGLAQPSVFVTLKMWASISLELLHLPDFLQAIQLLNGASAKLPLDEESKSKVREDILTLDMALGRRILNMSNDELCELTHLPDILYALGLNNARSALLYYLGYSDELRVDGSIPPTESDEEICRLFSTLRSQPVARSGNRFLIANESDPQTLATSILGMTVEICVHGSLQAAVAAETIFSSLEAFVATATEKRVIAHTEKLAVTLEETDGITQPTLAFSRLDMTALVKWPATLSVTNYERRDDVYRFFTEFAGEFLGTTCIVENVEGFLESLFVGEAVQHRMNLALVAPNSYHRISSTNAMRLSHWGDIARKSYPLKAIRPILTDGQVLGGGLEDEESGASGEMAPPRIESHKAVSVRSVIDIHAWDQARWRGAGYIQTPPLQPHYMALMFEKREGARKIFERWRERFGRDDSKDEIYLSIIRALPGQNAHHYCVLITAKPPALAGPNHTFVCPIRSMTMEPTSDTHLEEFLASYRCFGSFNLIPAILNSDGQPELLFDLAITKRTIIVKAAGEVQEHDIEAMCLRAAGPRRRE